MCAGARKLLLILSLIFLTSCAIPAPSQPTPPWTTGFWLWSESYNEAAGVNAPVDVLFVHAGRISDDQKPGWNIYTRLPDSLPPARQYWLVLRYEHQGLPKSEILRELSEKINDLIIGAHRRHLPIAGIQLDIDCSTAKLADYATFLHQVKAELPKGHELSITALLDWFRPGTAIASVVKEVDEFVPQFYDVADRSEYSPSTIAAPVDAAKWGPIFNGLQKRYRIGISTFGRARKIPAGSTASDRRLGIAGFNDLKLIDIAANSSFSSSAEHNKAGELVLSFRALNRFESDFNRFDPGDTAQFILATPESVHAAVANARQMKGLVSGVVFFRWSVSGETLAMEPDEVLAAVGASPPKPREHQIELIDGRCAAVTCADVYLTGATPFSSAPTRYRIHTSVELEYFVPEKNLPVKMSGPSQLEVSLPPYCGRGRLYLGRAITSSPSKFTVEAQ